MHYKNVLNINYFKNKKENTMFLSALFLLFVGLKLSDNIDWSWICVSIPLILELLRFTIKVTIETAIKEKRPWALKFKAWMKS